MQEQQGVAGVVSSFFEEGHPLRIQAFDGSVAGDLKSLQTLVVRSPQALKYVLSAPGELGLARAYITNHLEIQGDLHQALIAIQRYLKKRFPVNALVTAVKILGMTSVLPIKKPLEEAPPRWRRGLLHSLNRDKSAIHHHYDISNDFYSLVLGPTMVYSCAVFRSANDSLEEAQTEKVDLICRKLGLRPGMKLLDIGCGWGTLVMHAAKEYGVTAIGVTLSQRQVDLAQRRVARLGLEKMVDIRLQDYREVRDINFDAISSVGMSEHVGDKNLEKYFVSLRERVRDNGRLLNHCITQSRSGLPARSGAFIDRYIFPDGELSSPSRIVQAMQDSGFEFRHSENLREHYARTLKLWTENLQANWDQAVAEVGLSRARLWNLYMTLSRIGFELNEIEIHQFVGEATTVAGTTSMPLRPIW
jgi:cyclopropane-fatty-acyl-phospholipid synthase